MLPIGGPCRSARKQDAPLVLHMRYHPLGKKLQLAMEGRSDIDVDNGARREGLASASDFARPLVRRRPSRDDLRSQFEALVSNRVLECGWLCAPRQVQNSHCQATGSRFFLKRALPMFDPWPGSFSPSASLRKVVCARPLGCANACDE